MKFYFYYFLVGILISCTTPSPSSDGETSPPIQEKETLEDFSWLEGKWIRQNDPEGKQTFEQWEQLSPEVYKGLGYTMEGEDTVFKENIQLILRDENWFFEVTGVNESPTPFELIDIQEGEFTSRNEANEFPKQIHYALEDGQLVATISADSTTISFVFEPK